MSNKEVENMPNIEKKLAPCPFCGREIFNHFGDKAIIHKQGCPMLNGTTEYIKLLSTYELEKWNTRDPKSIILKQPKTYTRKELQKACAQAYQRGVDNRHYIEKFDEWFDDKSEE